MNALRWSHIDRTGEPLIGTGSCTDRWSLWSSDYGGAYVELPQEDFGSVLSVKFTNTEDLL